MTAKFSIITPSFNQGEFIKQTIDSVLAQNYPNFEHIIIDGGSTDNTVEVLKSYPHLNWISEADRGQSHALNKGFKKASGDIVTWINSDDWYAPNIFSDVAKALETSSVVMGACDFTDIHGIVTEHVPNIERNWYDILKYWIYYASPAQPSIFFTRAALEKIKFPNGDYIDEDLFYCMDYELWLRLARENPFTCRIDKVLSYFRNYDTNKSGQDMAASYREDSRVFKRHSIISCRAEHKISFVIPISEFTEDLKHTLVSIASQTLQDSELLFVDYSSTPQSASNLRKIARDLDRDIPQTCIRYVRSEKSDFCSALNKGIEAARACIVTFLEPGAKVADNYSFEASNLFEHDFLGVALPLKDKKDLVDYYSLQADGQRGVSLDALLSPKSIGFNFAARKVALMEIGGIKNTQSAAVALREIYLKMLYKGWQINIDNALSCTLPLSYPKEDGELIESGPYVISKLATDLETDFSGENFKKDPFGKLRQQHGFSFNFTEDFLKQAKSIMASAPENFKNSSAAQSSPAAVIIKKAPKNYQCLFLNTYYSEFLQHFYQQHPELINASYQEQLQALQDQSFGDSNFYSNGMRAAGWQATDVIMNCAPLQNRWALENKFSGQGLAIALEQVKLIKPDVLYCQDMHNTSLDFLKAVRPYCKLIVGQIASSIRGIPVKEYDIIVSSFVQFVEWFKSMGIKSYYQPLAFEESLLSKFQNQTYIQRTNDLAFVGGLSSEVHKDRQLFLNTLASELPVLFWGYGANNLPPDSPILKSYQGEAWGSKMFEVLFNSKITVNSHGEVTGCEGPLSPSADYNITRHYANNMRLFEATGCGVLLITDYKDNLNQLFEIGKEVVAYRSTEECISLVRYYLNNPEEAAKIAAAGQARTLKSHTYKERMRQTAEFLERHLRYKSESGMTAPTDMTRVSYGYHQIAENDVKQSYVEAWKSASIPAMQRGLVQSELDNMYKGEYIKPFQVLADLLRPITYEDTKILEIGCSSGYYYEIIEYLLNRRVKYTGADYSEHMIQMACDYYPNTPFVVGDGANLKFKNREFDIVISGGILLHTPNYDEHITETARLAGSYIVAHRTPVCKNTGTYLNKKFAYDVETVELRFNNDEFIKEFAKNGFELITTNEYNSDPTTDQYDISYLFKRTK